MFHFSNLVVETKGEGLHENMVERERRSKVKISKKSVISRVFLEFTLHATTHPSMWLEKEFVNFGIIHLFFSFLFREGL